VVIRKLRKVASSYYVIIDKTYLRALGIKQSDYVVVSLSKAAIEITKLKIKQEGKNV